MKHKLKDNKGSALLIAIVVMFVIMMLSLALLLVSFSLFASANKQQRVEQCKEIAQSLSREIEAEITGISFTDVNGNPSYNVQLNALKDGKNSLWFYLRYNVWQTSWPYYNVDESRGHGAANADRYFNLSVNGANTDVVDHTSVMMYWESESNADSNQKSDTALVVQVTCEIGRQKATITTTYTLEVSETRYSDAPAAEDQAVYTGPANPSNNKLSDPSEIWNWTFSERE